LELASKNPAVQEALRPDQAGWDVVVFDEAHRLTPTAQGLYRVGKLLTQQTPRALLMTATPHRGKEWLFRSLMNLVDPDVYPEGDPSAEDDRPMKPSRVHFLRRMKEDLRDYDGMTPLFKGRRAHNETIGLNVNEAVYYHEALALVDRYFPSTAVPLARMVYGKRAASSLYALAQTLRKRRDKMGSEIAAAAILDADPDDEDYVAQDEARIVHEQSRSAKAEQAEITALLARLDTLLADPAMPISKWPRMTTVCLGDNGIRPGNGEQAVIFTEYADTADWLVTRFRAAGFSAARYSGRDAHIERDAIRQRFSRREFQVLVSTDAGNEGIDLQTAHVLVNWDIPWSLVTLEQRMGRIHRVGQIRDVELYNLIATGTREGEVLQVLLGNFVVAANRLDGKMFDSLSLVAEMVGVDWEQLLSQTYAGDYNGHTALAAARAITASQVEEAARKAADEERALASKVDIASAVVALHQDTLERINPRIVEAYLGRLAGTGSYQVAPHAAGEGLFLISRSAEHSLPKSFGGGRHAIVATSGAALEAATESGANVSEAVTLGPSTPAFRSLAGMAADELRPALCQGSALRDPSSATGYGLFVYEATITEGGGKRRTTWPFLIRVDDAGARLVRWELLANLEPAESGAGRLHPAHRSDADSRAEQAVREEQARRIESLESWLTDAERDLQRLPSTIAGEISDAEVRRATRNRLAVTVKSRLSELRALATVEFSSPRPVGWAWVEPAGLPPDPTEADSEVIGMNRVSALFRADGWAVADVHLEGRGYDLLAVRGREQRCVEVKGVWRSAASAGVSLTGNELLIARQHGRDYWLYVVDECADGVGVLFGAYPDPAETFAESMLDATTVRIPGSALREALEEVMSS
jgi:superfamily II DNA or RNA helicase